MTPALTAALIAAGVLVLVVVLLFNSLVRHRNRTRDAFGGVDAQLKRRFDLVPNIVETVKAYARHEKETLEAVVSARGGIVQTAPIAGRAEGEALLAGALTGLLALVEQYPELKADENFRRLHDDLVTVEDAIQYARRYYNGTVRDYNTKLEQFPGNVVGSIFGFTPADFFQIEEDQR